MHRPLPWMPSAQFLESVPWKSPDSTRSPVPLWEPFYPRAVGIPAASCCTSLGPSAPPAAVNPPLAASRRRCLALLAWGILAGYLFAGFWGSCSGESPSGANSWDLPELLMPSPNPLATSSGLVPTDSKAPVSSSFGAELGL
ncbi:hypothetical protein MC885_012318 [Smutsia gigantea]|nr:hypothetical protein MC885_012318 [Smutsia gigantea]